MEGSVSWVTLGVWTQVMTIGDEAVAITFTEDAGTYPDGEGQQRPVYEFCCALTAELEATEVLFGLGGWGPGEPEWDDAWRRARLATEMVYREFRAER